MSEKDSSGLPDLTEQQMQFALAILEGRSATDAYKSAYNCEKSQITTIYANASRLRNNSNVKAWLEAAKAINLKHCHLTVDAHMAELAKIRDAAFNKANYGAAVKAEMARGQVAGFYISQHLDLTPSEKMTDAELKESIAKALGITQEEVDRRMSARLH